MYAHGKRGCKVVWMLGLNGTRYTVNRTFLIPPSFMMSRTFLPALKSIRLGLDCHRVRESGKLLGKEGEESLNYLVKSKEGKRTGEAAEHEILG